MHRKIPLYLYGQVVEYALVDKEDFSWASGVKWYFHPGGYAWCSVGRRPDRYVGLMHRLLMGLEKGDSREVDHRNRNRLDCRKKNLLVVPGKREQRQNVTGWGRSKFRGVYLDSRSGKWIATAGLNGRRYYIGAFDKEVDAGKAASEWRKLNMPYAVEIGEVIAAQS